MLPKNPFGTDLRRRRSSANLTQDELAERAGLSARAISDLERGVNRAPRRETARLLADALSLTIEERAAFEQVAQVARAAHELPEGDVPRVGWRLPAPAEPIVGRRAELAAVSRLLRRSEVRLVTITGLGGIGKTRVAVETVHRLGNRLGKPIFVSLAELRDVALMPFAIARAIGAPQTDSAAMLDGAMTRLAANTHLLVLDNFEHLLEASPFIAQLLAGCPRLTILVTSRAPLRLHGEHVIKLPPLDIPSTATPPDIEMLEAHSATQLFVSRARQMDASWSPRDVWAVAEICRRLDGLPLAIELAAARSNVLTERQIAERLDDRFTLLAARSPDIPARQRTLVATLNWSHDLLTPAQQALLLRLGVFVGGATLDAISAICGDAQNESVLDDLAALVDGSLIQRQAGAGAEPRFVMLETVRQYVWQRLDAAKELAALQARHASHYLDLAERAATQYAGPEQVVWFDRIESEHDNLRAALDWSLRAGAAETGLRLGAALWRFWETRGHLAEGRAWLARLLPFAEHAALMLRADFLNAAGNLAFRQRDQAASAEHYRSSLATASAAGSDHGVARAHNNLGLVMLDQRRYQQAAARFDRAKRIFRRLGDTEQIARTLNNRAIALQCLGRHREATRSLVESLRISQQRGDRYGSAERLGNLATVLAARGRHESAARFAAAELRLALEVGDRRNIVDALEHTAEGAVTRSAPQRGVRLYAAAAAMRAEMEEPRSAWDRHDEVIERVRVALGAQAFDALWAEGCRMSQEQAVATAMLHAVEPADGAAKRPRSRRKM